MRLSEVQIGTSVLVIGVRSSDRILLHKLLSMGVVQGTELTVTNVAPLGDPIEIRSRGFSLSLRLSEAWAIQVEQLKDSN